MLGFMCIGHNYSSNQINRTNINFYLQSDSSDDIINR